MFEHERVVLQVVRDGAGQLDTRQLDHEYYSRSRVLLEPNLLAVLRSLELRGLVESVDVVGGTGPGWVLTEDGHRVLASDEGDSCG